MPLPTQAKQPWPPTGTGAIVQDTLEAAAWYSGDEQALQRFYAGTAADTSARRVKFWGRRSADATRPKQRLHIPVAADIASTSADLLFGDSPRLLVPEAHQKADADAGAGSPGSSTEAQATENRLQEWIEEGSLGAVILEGAELCAGLGGVYLRPVWDDTGRTTDRPVLTVMHQDQAVPEWTMGTLTAVTFWRCLTSSGEKDGVWRHLERHEPGVILHGLYFGDDKTLGIRRNLKEHPETAYLAGAETDGVVPLPGGIRGLDVRYVPNVRPNRKHRGSPYGRSDTQGSEATMDAIDETWSSLMRDIRIGQARLIVPGEFLERRGRGQGARFDLDAEVFTPLEMDPASMDKAGITPVEFKIRTDEHLRTAAELFERIVTAAGYSPQTFGLHGDGSTMTATEATAREGRSIRTNSRKQRYWRPALADVLEIMLIVDREVYGSTVVPFRPRIEFVDPGQQDVRDVASTLNLLKLAEAASTETRVAMLHPEWDDTQVAEEAQRILKETGSILPDPTGGVPFGDPGAGGDGGAA